MIDVHAPGSVGWMGMCVGVGGVGGEADIRNRRRTAEGAGVAAAHAERLRWAVSGLVRGEGLVDLHDERAPPPAIRDQHLS